MKEHILVDCHTHTGHSFDADSSMKDMCEAAKQYGIEVYTVTDHCEAERSDMELSHGISQEEATQKSLEEINELREKYKGTGFQLLRGVEVGQPTQCLEVAERVVKREYDFVIGSLHALRNEGDFYYMGDRVLTPKEMDETLERYLIQTLEMIQWGKFDTLAHLGYPLRYLNGGALKGFGAQDELVDQVFRRLIEAGKALEVNTSRLMEGGQILPFPHYLKRYRQLGGELVTIGSDAHTPEKAGSGIREGYELLREAGFRYVFYYENRKPHGVKL
ncbi:MAG: histidinol-phosphatase HisJ family protein [Massiliimalia sp.]|jgi:histidinol-phosphatase (PHP family)